MGGRRRPYRRGCCRIRPADIAALAARSDDRLSGFGRLFALIQVGPDLIHGFPVNWCSPPRTAEGGDVVDVLIRRIMLDLERLDPGVTGNEAGDGDLLQDDVPRSATETRQSRLDLGPLPTPDADRADGPDRTDTADTDRPNRSYDRIRADTNRTRAWNRIDVGRRVIWQTLIEFVVPVHDGAVAELALIGDGVHVEVQVAVVLGLTDGRRHKPGKWYSRNTERKGGDCSGTSVACSSSRSHLCVHGGTGCRSQSRERRTDAYSPGRPI